MDTAVMPFISIIICTYNRAALLQRTLRALTQQSLPLKQFEVVVVDDGSQDHTVAICNQMRQELPHLRYISTGTNVGLAQARNVGIEAAAGDYVLFTDDDCIPHRHWVACMGAVLEQRALVGGAVASPVTNYLKLCHNVAEFHEFMPHQQAGPKAYVAGANMGFRRAVLQELQGFQADLRTAQDMELFLRARAQGYEVYFEPGAIVTHDPDRTTLACLFTYTVQHAGSTILLRHGYRELLHTPLILHSPVLLLAGAPLIALKVIVGIYWGWHSVGKFLWTVPVVYALKLAWCWGAARRLRSGKIPSNSLICRKFQVRQDVY